MVNKTELVIGGRAKDQALPLRAQDCTKNNLSPAGNTGGKKIEGIQAGGLSMVENQLENNAPKQCNSQAGHKPKLENYVMLHDGKKSLPVLINRPVAKEIVCIDWLASSHCASTYGDQFLGISELERDQRMDQLASLADVHIRRIFGFGIGEKRKTGMYRYSHSWLLEDNFGLFLAGHQTGRFTIDVNATGLSYAKKGWQFRYALYMNFAARSQISRIDLAYDDFQGAFDVDWALDQYKTCGFTSGGNKPEVSQMGNWIDPNGKGRTLGIGVRKNGKYGRIYEKGKELGDVNSPWVRHELELRNKDRIIPFDILVRPTSYFRAAYPCFMDFPMIAPMVRIKTQQKQSKITIVKAMALTSDSYGKYIFQFRQLFDDKTLLDILTHQKTEVPARLVPVEILAKRHFEEVKKSASQIQTAWDSRLQVITTEEVES